MRAGVEGQRGLLPNHHPPPLRPTSLNHHLPFHHNPTAPPPTTPYSPFITRSRGIRPYIPFPGLPQPLLSPPWVESGVGDGPSPFMTKSPLSPAPHLTRLISRLPPILPAHSAPAPQLPLPLPSALLRLTSKPTFAFALGTAGRERRRNENAHMNFSRTRQTAHHVLRSASGTRSSGQKRILASIVRVLELFWW